MKVMSISFAVGVFVGILYGVIRVKSPAPPIVALLGLLGWCLENNSAAGLSQRKSAWQMRPLFAL